MAITKVSDTQIEEDVKVVKDITVLLKKKEQKEEQRALLQTQVDGVDAELVILDAEIKKCTDAGVQLPVK